MSPVTRNTGFRLSPELLKRIDAHAEHLSAMAGVPVTRSAALVKLVTERLEQLEAEGKGTKTRKK